MNIAINYYGQLRDITRMIEMYNNFIKDDNINYHILWTTWTLENKEPFKIFFPNSYINSVEELGFNEYNTIINNFCMDKTNPNKTFEHYAKGLYIKNKSIETINNYEIENDISFDFIITIRTDIFIYDNHLSIFYKEIKKILTDDVIFIANEPKYNIYNQGGEPDCIFISNKVATKKMLNQINNLSNCTLNESNILHPETAFGKNIISNNLIKYNLNLRVFPMPL